MQRIIYSTFNPDDVIDIHVHIAGPRSENDEMYYYSEKFEKSIVFEGIKLVTKLNSSNMTGARYVSVLYNQIRESKFVDKIVLLGLDQVYTEDGRAEKEKTHLFVSNDYLRNLSQIYPEFLFGCSVHPYAPKALERLWQCAAEGAVLCKWLPSAQSIDPTHPLAVRFYRALSELGLPLLIHVGPEDAIPSSMNKEDELLVNAAAGKYGNNAGDAIVMALEEKATVIVAHSALPLGKFFDKDNDYWEQTFHLLLQRVKQADNIPLYADTSAFCLPGRFKYMEKIIPLAQEMPYRFLYGSDYPTPIVSLKSKRVEDILDAFGWLAERAFPTNDLDKNHQLLQPHFPPQMFTAAAKVLRNPNNDVPNLDKYLRRLGVKKRRLFWFF